MIQTPGDLQDHISAYTAVELNKQLFHITGLRLVQGNTGKQFCFIEINPIDVIPNMIGSGVYDKTILAQPEDYFFYWNVIDYLTQKLEPTRFLQAESVLQHGPNSSLQLQQAVKT